MASSSTVPQVKSALVSLLSSALSTSGVSGGAVHVDLVRRARRLLRKVEQDENGCWVWHGATNPNGYGTMTRGRRTEGRDYTHRISYELFVGPIPEGLVIDHLCRVRACCNPQHLEPVTQLVNTRRGVGHGSETHCPQAHPYDAANTIYKGNGRRQCRTCRNERERRRYARRKATA